MCVVNSGAHLSGLAWSEPGTVKCGYAVVENGMNITGRKASRKSGSNDTIDTRTPVDPGLRTVPVRPLPGKEKVSYRPLRTATNNVKHLGWSSLDGY